MFIGREQELRKLNQMYQSGKLEAAIIYGRRRVGKTTLITEFCKDKKTVFLRHKKTMRRKIWSHSPAPLRKSTPAALRLLTLEDIYKVPAT